MTFGATSPGGLTRSYARLSQARQEVIDARVWSGIHFRLADTDGARIGVDVARWREAHGVLAPRRR